MISDSRLPAGCVEGCEYLDRGGPGRIGEEQRNGQHADRRQGHERVSRPGQDPSSTDADRTSAEPSHGRPGKKSEPQEEPMQFPLWSQRARAAHQPRRQGDKAHDPEHMRDPHEEPGGLALDPARRGRPDAYRPGNVEVVVAEPAIASGHQGQFVTVLTGHDPLLHHAQTDRLVVHAEAIHRYQNDQSQQNKPTPVDDQRERR